MIRFTGAESGATMAMTRLAATMLPNPMLISRGSMRSSVCPASARPRRAPPPPPPPPPHPLPQQPPPPRQPLPRVCGQPPTLFGAHPQQTIERCAHDVLQVAPQGLGVLARLFQADDLGKGQQLLEGDGAAQPQGTLQLPRRRQVLPGQRQIGAQRAGAPAL